MPRGINKAILIGNLGADPELRYTANQKPVANLRVATTLEWRDKQSGEKQSKTEWHRVVLWGRLAEIADQYMKKGDQVYVEGIIETREYEARSGKRYVTEIVASTCLKMGMAGEERENVGGDGPPV